MASYFSIVQYVPDEVLGERINIGVVVYGDGGHTLTHFLSEWKRVRHFAPVDVVAELREFARQAKRMSGKDIRLAASKWTHGIQFSEPSGSLLDEHALLVDVAARFLVDPPEVAVRGYKVKSDVAKLARRRVREVLVGRLGGYASVLLRNEYMVFGAYGPHTFDLTIANGSPYVAAEAVSFQVPDQKKVEKDVSAAAWAIRDVRQKNPTLPLAVIAAAPNASGSNLFDRAVKAFSDEGAEVVLDANVETWARRVTANIPAQPSQ